jgi:hypothetical protein
VADDPLTFDQTLGALDVVLDRCAADGDRIGYFAAMYVAVTTTIGERADSGRFEDAARMERFVSHFARRYLDAVEAWRVGAPCTESWRAAFQASRQWRPIILQHLLLGMNAHINLDLGIAAAEVCPGDSLARLEHDFNEINTVLATLETDVEREVCTLSPWIDRLDHIDPRAGRVIANFSIDRARACSWRTAQRLAALAGSAREAAIDEEVARLARLIERPIGFVINLNLVLVRLRETWDARKVIEVLSGGAKRRIGAEAKGV